jgi:hypothetical protein
MNKIDFSKLLGFGSVSGEIADGVDFKDETLGAKLGAKMGEVEISTPMNVAKLLGFGSIDANLSEPGDKVK